MTQKNFMSARALNMEELDTEEFYERTRSEHGRVRECKRWFS